MHATFQIDHIVIMVDDLAQAIDNYTTLGFTVLHGGKHPGNPTHNALIVFADGAYIEIIALSPGDDTPMTTRLRKWVAAKPGLVDFALLPQDIEADAVAVRQRGLDIEDPQPGGRLRPDGVQVDWKTCNLAGSGLPFFCADVTPRSLRVPEGEACQHPNGVLGVVDLTIAVTNLKGSTDQYQALLGVPSQPQPSDDRLKAQTTRFTLGQTAITLAQPVDHSSPLNAYLAVGGERPFSFTLQTNQPQDNAQLDLTLTCQTRIFLKNR
jgi:catechol 2,3-dioxygenase-like lactoylglutathione lyase family enzyme